MLEPYRLLPQQAPSWALGRLIQLPLPWVESYMLGAAYRDRESRGHLLSYRVLDVHGGLNRACQLIVLDDGLVDMFLHWIVFWLLSRTSVLED